MVTTDVHVAIPVLLIAIPILGLAAIVSRHSSFYRTLVASEMSAKRFHSLDGLRGYLALGVAFHHVAVNYHYYQSGYWESVSDVGRFLGKGSVAFFFMITAFLFWNRAIDECGHLDAYKFYLSRVRRIVPMYLVAALLVIATALAVTGFTPQVSPFELFQGLMAWIFFNFPGPLPVNGFAETRLINTVFWSLVWEWKFYFVLPFLAMFAGPRYRWTAASVVALILWCFDDTAFGWFFLAGAVAAMITRFEVVRAAGNKLVASVVAIACIAAVIRYIPWAYEFWGAVLLFVPFTIFAAGNSLFGVLTCRPARVLGILSYSVYLLHNWVLFVISWIAAKYVSVGSLPEEWYWTLGAAVVTITMALAAVSYRFVEHPYLRRALPSARVAPERTESASSAITQAGSQHVRAQQRARAL